MPLKKTVQSYSQKPKMLWERHDEPAERTLHGASVGGRIGGVNRLTILVGCVDTAAGRATINQVLDLNQYYSHSEIRRVGI